MSAPEQGASGSNPEKGPAVEFESTGLWPIDDHELTSHIKRPPTPSPVSTRPPTAEPPTPTPGWDPPAGPTYREDPEATTVVPRGGNPTQPWTSETPPPAPTPGPAAGYGPPPQPTYGPAAGYYQYQQPASPSGYAQGARYPHTPEYRTGAPGYPPAPRYAPPQQSPAGEPPTHFDITAPTKTVNRSRRRAGLLIGAGAIAVIAAAVGITGFWKPGFFITRQLNIAKVQDGVQHILTDQNTGYGISGVSGLTCNNGLNASANQGDKFTCDMMINGAKRHVEVTVTDDKGTYQVGKVT